MTLIEEPTQLIFEFDQEEIDDMLRQMHEDDVPALLHNHLDKVMELIFYVCRQSGRGELVENLPPRMPVSAKMNQHGLQIAIPTFAPHPDDDQSYQNYEGYCEPGAAYVFNKLTDAYDAIKITCPPFAALYKRGDKYMVYTGDFYVLLNEFAIAEQKGIYLPDDIICIFEDGEGVKYER